MICNNCGSDNPSGTRFCQTCGASLTEEMEPQFDYEAPQPGNPLTRAVKKVAGSGTFFFATLCFTAAIVLTILSSYYGTVDIAKTFENVVRPYTADFDALAIGITSDDLFKYIEALPIQNMLAVVIAQIPSMLYALALWMIFFSGLMKNSFSTAGITMIKVFKIIKFVFVIVGNLILLGFCALGTYTLYEDPEEFDDLYKYALAATLLGALFFILAIIYYAKLIGSLTAAKMAMKGQPGGKFSGYAALVLVLYGLVNIISLVASAVILSDYYGMAAAIVGGLSTILYAFMIGRTRRAVYTDLN